MRTEEEIRYKMMTLRDAKARIPVGVIRTGDNRGDIDSSSLRVELFGAIEALEWVLGDDRMEKDLEQVIKGAKR